MPLNQNYAQWTPKSVYSKGLTIRNQQNTNETLVGGQNFLPNQNQPRSYGGSTCYDQKILNSRSFSILKPQPENECADSPTLTTNSERSEITEASSDYNFQFANAPNPQIMQQPDMHMMFKQLQEFQRQQQLGDFRQQSPLNQFSVSQYPPLINGTPVHDTQMLRDWTPGVSNKVIFPQEQIDVYLYGTPVSNPRANISQYPQFQDSVNLLTKGDQNAVSELQMRGNFGQFPAQVNASTGQERTKQFGSSLDPMEAKILYNMDENVWDAFGNRPDSEFGNTLENLDSNSLSSFQCGTWSALMQSAVAEASSSDTELQEEWSGLTFQSTDNHISSFVEIEKQQACSTFPGFNQPGMQSLAKQREDFCNDSLNESTVNYNPQKPSVEQFIHSDNTWTGQMLEKSATKHEEGVLSGISVNRGNDSIGNSQHHQSNGPHESQEKWQNHQQRENSNDFSKGHGDQSKFFGNFSSSAMNVEKGSIPNFQKLANPNSVLVPRAITDLNSIQVNAELGEKREAWHTPFSFNSSLPSYELAQRWHWDNYSGSPGPTNLFPYADMQGNSAVSSSSPNRPGTRIQLQTNQSPGSSSRFSPFNQMPCQDTLEQMQSNCVSQPFPILGTEPVSHHSNLPGMSQQAGPYNVWRNVPTQRPPPYLESANNNMSRSSHAPVDQSTIEGGYKSSEVTTSSYIHGGEQQQITSPGGVSHGQEHISNVTSLNSCSMLSLSQQQHIDKAMNNADNALDIQHTAALGGQQFQDNISRLRNLVNSLPGNAQVLGFSRDDPASQTAFHSVSPLDIETQASSNNVLSNHTEHADVNLQMVNSWYNQCGTPKNGQISPVFDASLAKAAALQVSLENPSQNLHIESSLRPKKRKFMALELVPWHEEAMQETKMPQNINVAERDWAQATTRLIEKVEDEVNMMEVLQRAKRRLVLTMQLLQQLLRPAPASFFSTDAATNYSIISHLVSRLSLGDSCSTVNNTNNNSEKPKSESSSQQILDFGDRMKLLENEFERLDKTASIAIIRAELQELERFTVINRFAEFHVRGHMDGSVPKVSPHRHKTAIPVPQILPQGEQCLSL